MMKNKLKFKKLLNQYRALQYEHEYIKEVLKDAHRDFDDYYRNYCVENDIDIPALEKKNKSRIESVFGKNEKPKIKGIEEKIRAKDYDYKKMFKQIARKLHPDKLDQDDPRLKEFEEDFKTAAAGINGGNWGDLFNIAEKYDIDIEDYEKVNKSLKESTEILNKKIDALKTQYSYMFHECEDDTRCKDNIIKSFIKQVFKINI